MLSRRFLSWINKMILKAGSIGYAKIKQVGRKYLVEQNLLTLEGRGV